MEKIEFTGELKDGYFSKRCIDENTTMNLQFEVFGQISAEIATLLNKKIKVTIEVLKE